MSAAPDRVYDVVVVGAGPAGLSAALILGRCRRSVLVCDTGRPRNARSQALHGYLTRDGIPPLEFLRIAREQVAKYDTIELRHVQVTDASCREDKRFDVTLAGGERVRARKLLLATGVVDNLPAIDGLSELYGRSVFHCPYCDGWELCDLPIAIYGRGERGLGLSLELTAWSRDLVLCTDGPSEIDGDGLERLRRNRIAIREEPVARVEGRDGVLEHIVFDNGERLPRRALFFTTGQTQRSDLSIRLGCEVNEKGTVSTGKYETTHLEGLYVAGDASRAVQWVVVAAAEGAEAAFAINTALIKEELA
ncbi:MAG TPA: NAD(P)/FAD-dependent oxidoreductase [Vicinamibacterales bacterium]|nr:NAD(P)/FAD-dependent oxidoreductase [Vicinamibacterales bacterium]